MALASETSEIIQTEEAADSSNLKPVIHSKSGTLSNLSIYPEDSFETLKVRELSWKSRFNPCGCCVCRSCSLRRNCFAIGVVEIVYWVFALLFLFLIRDPQSNVQKDLRSMHQAVFNDKTDEETYAAAVNTSFVVLLSLLVGFSVTAGFTIIIGVLTRSKIICVIHTILDLIILAIIFAFIILFFYMPGLDYYKIIIGLGLSGVYCYFATCSYGMYLQIDRGMDFRNHRNLATVYCL